MLIEIKILLESGNRFKIVNKAKKSGLTLENNQARLKSKCLSWCIHKVRPVP